MSEKSGPRCVGCGKRMRVLKGNGWTSIVGYGLTKRLIGPAFHSLRCATAYATARYTEDGRGYGPGQREGIETLRSSKVKK